MPDKASPEYRGEAAAAFDRVLDAERAAEASVAACREQAAGLLAAAHERKRALQEDVEARIAAWRVRLTSKADRAIAALESEAARWAEPAAPDATGKDRIRRVVARLADELIDGG